jgi:hypothetical protein
MTGRHGVGRRDPAGPPRSDDGMLSLEAVMLLPVLALLMLSLFEVAAVLRDVLVLHEAARSGARVAATSSGAAPVVHAARAAAPELELAVEVRPQVRRAGDQVTVVVHAQRTVGPINHRLRAQAVARVEPAVGTMPLQAPP